MIYIILLLFILLCLGTIIYRTKKSSIVIELDGSDTKKVTRSILSLISMGIILTSILFMPNASSFSLGSMLVFLLLIALVIIVAMFKK